MKEWFVGFTVAFLVITLVIGTAGGFMYLVAVVLPKWVGIPLFLGAVIAGCTVDECKALGKDLLK